MQELNNATAYQAEMVRASPVGNGHCLVFVWHEDNLPEYCLGLVTIMKQSSLFIPEHDIHQTCQNACMMHTQYPSLMEGKYTSIIRFLCWWEIKLKCYWCFEGTFHRYLLLLVVYVFFNFFV